MLGKEEKRHPNTRRRISGTSKEWMGQAVGAGQGSDWQGRRPDRMPAAGWSLVECGAVSGNGMVTMQANDQENQDATATATQQWNGPKVK